MNKIRAIKSDILVSEIEQGIRKLASGLIIPDDNAKDRGIRPRWCQVYAVGPTADADVSVGQWVLVAHGRWTRAAEITLEDGSKMEIRRVDPDGLLLVSDEKPDDNQWAYKAFNG
jgi:co-chaperonin GroES (HSP10)